MSVFYFTQNVKQPLESSRDLYDKINFISSHVSHTLSMSMSNPRIIPEQTKKMYGAILDNLKQKFITHPFSETQFLMYTLEQYYSLEQTKTSLSYIDDEVKKTEKPNEELLQKIFYKLPTYYSNCMLIYKNMRIQNKDQKVNENDFRDMLYLSYMIPYCDVVVTEKKWVNIAKQIHLNEIFGTTLISDVNDLSFI